MLQHFSFSVFFSALSNSSRRDTNNERAGNITSGGHFPFRYCIGILVYWCIAVWVYWCIGILVYWCIAYDHYIYYLSVVTLPLWVNAFCFPIIPIHFLSLISNIRIPTMA
jgi:hypothetical protein